MLQNETLKKMKPTSSSELSVHEQENMDKTSCGKSSEDYSLPWPWDTEKKDQHSTHYNSKIKFPWDTEKADIFIKVENFLFPVQKTIISSQSSVLRKLIGLQLKEDVLKDSILVENSSAMEMKELLTFIYHPRKKIDDSNALSALELAETFQVPRLKTKCEEYLLKNKVYYDPIDLLHTATTYSLTKVLDYAMQEVSTVPDFECLDDFNQLDICVQQRVIQMAKRKQIKGGYKSTVCNEPKGKQFIGGYNTTASREQKEKHTSVGSNAPNLNDVPTSVKELKESNTELTDIYYKNRKDSFNPCDSLSETEDEEYDADSEEGFSDDESVKKKPQNETCSKQHSHKNKKSDRMSPSKFMNRSKTFLRKVFRTKSHSISKKSGAM